VGGEKERKGEKKKRKRKAHFYRNILALERQGRGEREGRGEKKKKKWLATLFFVHGERPLSSNEKGGKEKGKKKEKRFSSSNWPDATRKGGRKEGGKKKEALVLITTFQRTRTVTRTKLQEERKK